VGGDYAVTSTQYRTVLGFGSNSANRGELLHSERRAGKNPPHHAAGSGEKPELHRAPVSSAVGGQLGSRLEKRGGSHKVNTLAWCCGKVLK